MEEEKETRREVVLSIMAKDRSGIVSEATGAIAELGGNLADLRESVLCGYFTMILIADFPAEYSLEKIGQEVALATSAKVSVEEFESNVEPLRKDEQTYILSAAGPDRAGLVAQVSRFCAEQGVNILDFASHVENEQYTMILQLDLSSISSVESFREKLKELKQSSQLNLVLQHNNIFRATNEI